MVINYLSDGFNSSVLDLNHKPLLFFSIHQYHCASCSHKVQMNVHLAERDHTIEAAANVTQKYMI